MGSEPPPTTTMSAPLLEASGDSEWNYPLTADHGGWPVDVDEGDAESCCGGEAADSSVEVLSWERWMRDCASYQLVVGDNGECAASASEDVATAAESDRLFWEACIAHGF